MERKRIGIGQSSTVWASDNASTAIKIPYQDTIDDVKFEKSVYEKLGPHRRVAEYLGPKRNGIELKFYKEGNVDSKLKNLGFDIPALKWAEQIAEGLTFIHNCGIVHGDLRGANLLLDDRLNLVLADFGSAAINGVKGTSVSYDTRHCIPGFDNPDHKITPRDDLFAFGTVLYHLSTRRVPYDDQSKEMTAQLFKKETFPDVSGLEMGGIIERCWRRLYTSANEIQSDFRQLHSFPSQNLIIPSPGDAENIEVSYV